MNTETLKNTFQDCNINLLIGAGLSCPFLPTLGNLETFLTQLEGRSGLSDDARALVRASLYKKYFDTVIRKNLSILRHEPEPMEVRHSYRAMLTAANLVLLKRKTTILSKEVNLFTTNVDIFLDQSLEDLGLEFNDGFSGRFTPRFGLGNFQKTHFAKSSHYGNTAELPTFNLFKLHGSISWSEGHDAVRFSQDLAHIEALCPLSDALVQALSVPNDATLESLITEAGATVPDASTRSFVAEYERRLLLVNPTKDKFRSTLLNQTYYEMLRVYSNSLERENTFLLAMGFSFADEHIRDITLRAAASNPTLLVCVVAYNAQSEAELKARLGTSPHNNVKIIAPPRDAHDEDCFVYDLSTINARLFGSMLAAIDGMRESTAGDPTTTTP